MRHTAIPPAKFYAESLTANTAAASGKNNQFKIVIAGKYGIILLPYSDDSELN